MKALPGCPVQNCPSGSFLFWGGAVGSGGIAGITSEGNPGKCAYTSVCFRILSTSFRLVSIFSVWCYSSVSISMVATLALVVWCSNHTARPYLHMYAVYSVRKLHRPLVIHQSVLYCHAWHITNIWHLQKDRFLSCSLMQGTEFTLLPSFLSRSRPFLDTQLKFSLNQHWKN